MTTAVPNLSLAPSASALAGAEVELASADNREYRLAQMITAGDQDPELVFVDCPPSLGLLTVNALTAADSVVIPVQCEYLALEGLAQLMQTIALVRERLNSRLRLFGLVMTMFDGRANLSQQVVDQVAANFPAEIFRTVIPRSVRIAEAPSHGEPLLTYDPRSRGAQAYELLAEEFLAREMGGRGDADMERRAPRPAPRPLGPGSGFGVRDAETEGHGDTETPAPRHSFGGSYDN